MVIDGIVGRVSTLEARGMLARYAWTLHALVEVDGDVRTLIRNTITGVVFEVVEPEEPAMPNLLDPDTKERSGPWSDI